MERKLGERFPLPAPKMAARASTARETHALCPYLGLSGLTGLLQVTMGTLNGGGFRAPAVIPPPIPSPKPLYPSKNALEALSLFTSLHAHAVIPPAAEARPRVPNAGRFLPYLLVGPRAGLHAYWARDHVSLEKPVKGEGGILSYWALFTISQSDIRRRPPSRLLLEKRILGEGTRRAGFRVRWKGRGGSGGWRAPRPAGGGGCKAWTRAEGLLVAAADAELSSGYQARFFP